MHKTQTKRRRGRLIFVVLLSILLLLFGINLLLQSFWAHRSAYFVPDYPQVDLAALLAQPTLADADYDTLLFQTGLARPAISALMALGDEGTLRIVSTQQGFFAPHGAACVTLIGGRFTCEDRMLDENGTPAAAVLLAPLEQGDIVLSFSTHSFGWRHGHGGLVVDAENGVTLEAVVMGSDSAQMYARHWPTYSNFIVLRVKGTSPAQRQAVADFALTHLDGIPYGLLSGLWGEKAPDPEGALTAQCAYLPWYAWNAAGYDLDSDGGRLVTINDISKSPLLEVVQVFGIDPRG